MTDEENDDVLIILNGIREHIDTGELTDWEYKFAEDQLNRYEQYGARTRFSDKQMEVLNRIYAKLPI